MDKKTLHLDETDHAIVHALANNSRMSSRDVAKHVGVSHQTVLSRIKMLEDEGIISKYGAFVNWFKLGFPVVTMTLIETGKFDEKSFKTVGDYIRTEKSFVSASQLDGTYDIYIIGVFRNQEQAKEKISKFRSFLSENLDVKSFKNHAVWDVIKHTHASPLEKDEPVKK
ncbi:Lrp/AsnC family transcriptional regulator [Candidatus Micrarchaeota archaeon]|nr:Lrp/AsnC family transcriptional regulator [Candidatus Micrarchaeota archaeon]